MRIMLLIVLVVAAFGASSPKAAEKAEPAVKADTKEAFVAVASKTREQMQQGGRFSRVTEAEKSKVEARLDEMGKLFDQRESVAQMSDDEKTLLFNAQEEVNSILMKKDDDRLICKNELPIGSHLPVKTCRTVGEIENRRRTDNKTIQDVQRRTPQKPGIAGS